MAKYIDREALIEWLKRIPLIDLSDGRGLCRVIMEDDFKRAIKKIPKGIIVDVSPVRHGRWLHTEEPLGWKDVDRQAYFLEKAMQTVDAVPVVRCLECKHCDPENHYCDHPMSTAAPLSRKPDDFCSYGERKEGAD